MSDANPPAAPAAPAPPRSSVLPKVLVGLGVLVLVGILVGVGLWWVGHKVKQYADDPAALAALVTARDPDLEVVSRDDARKTVTIRNKKTGETLTFDSAKLEEGKFEGINEKGEKITIAGGQGTTKIESEEGTTTIGDDAAGSVPAWVPAYPGAKPQGAFAEHREEGAAGVFAFKTADAVQDVLARYESDLRSGGFEVEKKLSGEAGVVAAKQADGRQVHVTAMRDGEVTAVGVQYQQKK